MKNHIFIIITFALFGTSCSKEVSEVIQRDYPYNNGNKWIYQYIYDYPQHTETVTVTIIGDDTLSNGVKVKKVLYEYPNYTDINFLYYSNDTLIFYETQSSGSNIYGFVFPLEVGKTWTNFNSAMRRDSTIVFQERLFEVFPNKFYLGYELNSFGWVFEGGYSSYIIFVPGIGIIQNSTWGILYSLTIKLIKINFKPPKEGGY